MDSGSELPLLKSSLNSDFKMVGSPGITEICDVPSQEESKTRQREKQNESMHKDNVTAMQFTFPEVYTAAATGSVGLFQKRSADLELSRLKRGSEPSLVKSSLNSDIKMAGSLSIWETCDVPSQEESKTRQREKQNESTHEDYVTTMHFTYPEVYTAAATGNVGWFQKRSEDLELSLLTQLASPRGNRVLHVAAQSGHDELVRVILKRHDRSALLVSKNSAQDTPLHVAASAGYFSTVKILVSAAEECDKKAIGSSSSSSLKTLLTCRNKKNNTALHLALKNRHKQLARFLFEADPEVAYYLNGKGKSPLFEAAEAGYGVLFELMLKTPAPDEMVLVDKAKIASAAVWSKKRGILYLIMHKWPEVFTTNARKIWHPILLASFTGYLEGVRDILNKFRECSFFANNSEGLFPIHVASAKGHVAIIQEFLKHCPDSRELHNKKKQNILHLAAENGKDKAVSYILKNPELQMLINEKDSDGNTPLHLAVLASHPNVVSIMTWDSRVDLELLNRRKQTALDVAECKDNWLGSTPSFRQRLTWQALRHAGAPRGKDRKFEDIMSELQSPRSSSSHRKDRMSKEFYKDRINTLMLVSTLIVTVTFAAGLVSPGSDDSSEQNQGLFNTFVITNTIALYSSISIVVALIWAQLGDSDLALASLEYTQPVLGLSLAMVSLAFMAGAYLIASNHSVRLAYSVLVLSSLGFLVSFVIFFHLCIPDSLRYRVTRYIFYLPFYMMIKLTQRDNK